MADLARIPRLDSAAKCAALWPKYPEKAVGLWATGFPRQNVDVLWRLRQELVALGVPVVFFFEESAKPVLRPLLEGDCPAPLADIYQLDDARLFRLLGFLEVLVTTFGVWSKDHRFVGAKLVSIAAVANMVNPGIYSYYYDYIIGELDPRKSRDHRNIDNRRIDYGLYPDACKIHRNRHLTQMMAGYPKIDLLSEERQKNAARPPVSVLLLYPSYLDFCATLQQISPDGYENIWADAVAAFLAWRPDGIAVFRPKTEDLKHPVVRRLRERFAEDGRFIIDAELDNKFWLSRADYFLTDFSEARANFALSALRPGIRMIYKPAEEPPVRDDYGWTVSRPGQIVPLMKEMEADATLWTHDLLETRKRVTPGFGRNFTLIAGMIKRIFDNDDDPEWYVEPKGETPLRNQADLLKLVAKATTKSNLDLFCLRFWLEDVLRAAGDRPSPGIWLPLLRRALLHWPGDDSVPEIVRLWDRSLGKALAELPPAQSIGLLRHCMRKDPRRCAETLLMAATHSRFSGRQKNWRCSSC